MSTTLIKCHICLDFKGTSDFRFFPCGHGFCYTPCIDELFSRSTSKFSAFCPQCRSRIRPGDARPIYLEIATPQEEQAMAIERLVHGLAKMSEDSKSISVEIAEKKLKKLAKRLDNSESNVVLLLEAVMDFKERIIPLFKKAENQSLEIECLKRQLSNCQTEVAASVGRIETLEIERDNARNTLQEAIDEREEALGLAKQVVQETVRLREDLARVKAQESEFEDTKALYKAQLLGHKEMERKQSEKIKSLKQQLTAAQQVQYEWHAQSEVDLGPQTPLSQRSLKRRATSPPTPLQTQAPMNTKSTLFEAMPAPGQFGSNWRLTRPDLKKQKVADTFPVNLDKHGRPIGSVQIGIRKTIRITR